MKTWTTAIALIAAGTMLAGSAFAQATSPSGDQKDKAKSPSAASPSSTDTTKSDSGAMKSDSGATKSDSSTAKPDMSK